MEKQKRKELIADYKNLPEIGGIYAIKNTKTGKSLVLNTNNLKKSKNRFEFSQKMNLCQNFQIKEDFKKFGPDAFIFEELETLTKKETQTAQEYKEDIETLYEIWLEKFKPEDLY